MPQKSIISLFTSNLINYFFELGECFKKKSKNDIFGSKHDLSVKNQICKINVRISSR